MLGVKAVPVLVPFKAYPFRALMPVPQGNGIEQCSAAESAVKSLPGGRGLRMDDSSLLDFKGPWE